MNNRISLIRKETGLSRASFGKRIGVSGDVVNNLERGRVEIKEHMILLICKEFDVNETWIRTGEGEMFLGSDRDKLLANFTMQMLTHTNEETVNRFVSALSKLDVEQWELIANMADALVKKKE